MAFGEPPPTATTPQQEKARSSSPAAPSTTAGTEPDSSQAVTANAALTARPVAPPSIRSSAFSISVLIIAVAGWAYYASWLELTYGLGRLSIAAGVVGFLALLSGVLTHRNSFALIMPALGWASAIMYAIAAFLETGNWTVRAYILGILILFAVVAARSLGAGYRVRRYREQLAEYRRAVVGTATVGAPETEKAVAVTVAAPVTAALTQLAVEPSPPEVDASQLTRSASPVPLPDLARFDSIAAEAMRHAVSMRQSGQALDTRIVLLAVTKVHVRGNWDRIWLQCSRTPEDIAVQRSLRDPRDEPHQLWNGTELTASCADALRMAARIGGRYDLPIAPGVLILGLVTDPITAAARALGAGVTIEHEELLGLIAQELLDISDLRIPD